MTAAAAKTVLIYTDTALLLLAFCGPMIGLRRRFCRKLWVVADVFGIAANGLGLPDLLSVFLVVVWMGALAADLIRLIHGDDDDDDRPPRRRRRFKLRAPDLSRLVLPGILRPVGGAA